LLRREKSAAPFKTGLIHQGGEVMRTNGLSNATLSFVRKICAAAVSVVLFTGWAANAVAQSDDDTIEEIVVAGFRGSLRQSLDVKRNSSGIVDAIAAEDIADFPI